MSILPEQMRSFTSDVKIMNYKNWVGVMAVALCATANAALYNSGFANNGAIPDGNVTGWSDTRTLSGLNSQISDLTINLQISGGFNGDLYGYLSHNNVLIPLVNRVGVNAGNAFGYSDSGLNVTLSDGGVNGDIHFYGNVSGFATKISNGSGFTADGRNIDPASSPSSFDSGSRSSFASTFGGMDPNGTWTLFFADMSGGGGTSTLSSWDLEITAVPEPTNIALGCFASLFVSVQSVRWWKRKAQSVIAA